MEETTTQPFAIIETGAKQYKVSVGDVVMVEKISDDLKPGDKVTFDKVLLTDNNGDTKVGTPLVEGTKVIGELITNGKQRKLDIVRFRSKSNYHRHLGHRQPFSKVEIKEIK